MYIETKHTVERKMKVRKQMGSGYRAICNSVYNKKKKRERDQFLGFMQ